MIEDDLTFPEYPISMVLCNLCSMGAFGALVKQDDLVVFQKRAIENEYALFQWFCATSIL